MLIEREDMKKATSSGILLPEQAQEKPREGIVVAVGWADAEKHQVRPGDRVMMPKYGGVEVDSMVGAHNHILIDVDDILGIMVPVLIKDPYLGGVAGSVASGAAILGTKVEQCVDSAGVFIDNASVVEKDVPSDDDFDEPLGERKCEEGEACESCT